MSWTKLGCTVGGFLLGTAGVKILRSKDARKVYTHVTAAVLRMKDETERQAQIVREECSDIYADAQALNAARAAEQEVRLIGDEDEVADPS